MLKDNTATINRNQQGAAEGVDDDDDNFEEVDLDDQTTPKQATEYEPGHTDDEFYEEHSLDASSAGGARRLQKSLMKQIDRIMKLDLYIPSEEEKETEILLQ